MATAPKKPADDEADAKAAGKAKPASDAPASTAQEPYPTGSPPDPEDAFEAAHGFRRTPKKEG